MIAAFHGKFLQLNTTACHTELQCLERTDRHKTRSKVLPPKWWQFPIITHPRVSYCNYEMTLVVKKCFKEL